VTRILLYTGKGGVGKTSVAAASALLCAERGYRTIVLSTHILEIAQALCDRVAIMNRGRVVAVGTLEELRSGAGSSEASLEELFLQLTGGAESKDVIDQLMKS